MKRRYRSLRPSFKMKVSPTKILLWDGYRYPPKNDPPCEDKEIIEFIEGRPGFGKNFWPEDNPDKVLVDPAKVPVDCELAHLQKAAERLQAMGINVNPGLLKKDEDEAPQLPSKTSVSSMKRGELEALIKKFDWDIDLSLKVKDLKAAIREKVEESS